MGKATCLARWADTHTHTGGPTHTCTTRSIPADAWSGAFMCVRVCVCVFVCVCVCVSLQDAAAAAAVDAGMRETPFALLMTQRPELAQVRHGF